MAKRYLVTGAAGFIGANLVARLKAQGHWVRAVDVKETPERAHLYEQADEVLTDCELRLEDSDRRKCCEDALGDRYGDSGVDRVFHLAADHGGAGYFHGPMDYKAAENNLLIDQNVRKAALANGVERLFFASSACTYPTTIQGPGARAVKESDWGGGQAEALYGEAKRMSTLMFEGAREHGLDARCGLFHTIYGPTQDTEEPRAKFPTAICRKVIENPDRVEVWGDGTQVRTFLYIEDALDRIQAMMEQPYSGPVNLGSDERVTVQECCEWVAEAAGASPEWVYTDGPTGVAARAADNTLWNSRYGEGQLTPAREGFEGSTAGWPSSVSLLSDAEIEGMRATASDALDGSAVIQTLSFVSDGGGGGTALWTASGTAPCRLAPYMSGGSSEGVEGERLATESQVIFTFPAQTEVDHNARIVFDDRPFEVTAIRQRSRR